MALTGAVFQVLMSWQQNRAVTGFDSPTQNSKLVGSVQPTVAPGSAQQILQVSGTLAAAASVTLDLFSFVEAAFGQTIAGTGAYAVVVKGTGSSWSFQPGASNALTWFLSGTAPVITGGDGASFGFGDPSPVTIDATHRNLKISNPGGTLLTYYISVIVKTA